MSSLKNTTDGLRAYTQMSILDRALRQLGLSDQLSGTVIALDERDCAIGELIEPQHELTKPIDAMRHARVRDRLYLELIAVDGPETDWDYCADSLAKGTSNNSHVFEVDR